MPEVKKPAKIIADNNPFGIVRQQIDDCAEILKLSPEVTAMLKNPLRELHVSLPVRMDNGKIKVFQGFRVQYNDARGACKGGIRFHPDETIDTCPRTVCLDDLEMRSGGYSAGRRQRGCYLQS